MFALIEVFAVGFGAVAEEPKALVITGAVIVFVELSGDSWVLVAVYGAVEVARGAPRTVVGLITGVADVSDFTPFAELPKPANAFVNVGVDVLKGFFNLGAGISPCAANLSLSAFFT